MALSKVEIGFLNKTLKLVVRKMGTPNKVVEILKKRKRSKPKEPQVKEKSVLERYDDFKKSLFTNSQNPPTDYGRPRYPMGG